MIAMCPVCGVVTDVLYPDQWAFRRKKRSGACWYFCSWSCLRAWDDKKGSNKDMKLTEKQKKQAIEMALRGESPLKFIRNCGINNPSCTWWNIRKYLQKNDPETYAKLPEGVTSQQQPKAPEAKAPVVKVSGPLTIETPEAGKVKIVETPEKKIGGLCPPPDEIESFCRVTALDTPIGEFHYDKRHGYLDWDWDNNTMSLNMEEWKEFRKWFPIVLKQLGVKL